MKLADYVPERIRKLLVPDKAPEAQRKYEEAEGRYRQALVIFEKTIGKDNPYYTSCLNDLAAMLKAQGRNDEADELCR